MIATGQRVTSPSGFANATICTGNVTVIGTTTVISAVTVERVFYVNTTQTSTVETCVTETKTKTDLAVITNTQTDLAVVTNTKTDLATVINTKTDVTHVTNTETKIESSTTTTTISSTVTATLTTTVMSTKVDPCPSSCSISAATVNLYFWPTDRPHSYPTTYVHPELNYTL